MSLLNEYPKEFGKAYLGYLLNKACWISRSIDGLVARPLRIPLSLVSNMAWAISRSIDGLVASLHWTRTRRVFKEEVSKRAV